MSRSAICTKTPPLWTCSSEASTTITILSYFPGVKTIELDRPLIIYCFGVLVSNHPAKSTYVFLLASYTSGSVVQDSF